jgi:hypothetical protein
VSSRSESLCGYCSHPEKEHSEHGCNGDVRDDICECPGFEPMDAAFRLNEALRTADSDEHTTLIRAALTEAARGSAKGEEDNPTPKIRFDFFLVGHGYEMQVFIDGKPNGFECRDFSGNHRIKTLVGSLFRAIDKAVGEWRDKQ